MANIDIKKFVDINIQAPVIRSVDATRKTVVLFTPEGVNGTVVEFESYADAVATLNATTFVNTLAYLKVFFEANGVKCRVIEGTAYTALSTTVLKNLANDYIVVACVVPSANMAAGYTALSALAQSMEEDTEVYGVNEKVILARTTDSTDTNVAKNFVAKYSSVLGAEMTVAAYFSQVNIKRQNSIWDYCFTAEPKLDPEDIDTSTFETLMTNNYNVDISLGGATRNLGGNMKNGQDAINEYVRIVLHQTLTQRLVDLLVTKLKGSDGVGAIYTAITQELEIYRDAGYLTTDKIWTADDLTKVYNGQQYTIIEKGTALTTGYHIRVLPLLSLSAEDKADRKAPPIYVILADQYGIRQITINGEVI